MKYIYDELGKRIATHHEGTEEELRLQYKDVGKIYISNDYLGETAVIENDTARAKTEAEKVADGERILQDGEYIDGTEIKYKEKPSNFYFWDKNTNEWVYDQELEISSLEDELGSLEIKIYMKNNEIELLKKDNKTFAAKKLEKEVAELDKSYQGKMKRYEELEE